MRRLSALIPAAGLAFALATAACAEEVDLNQLPSYKPETKVQGVITVGGSYLRGYIQLLENAFLKYHPDAEFANALYTSSEGAMAHLYISRVNIAPAGDDAKLTDIMPFHQTFRYVPTEISIATGGYEARGTLWAFAIVVNKDNPIEHLSVSQIERIFGEQRSGGWEVADNEWKYTAKYARSADQDIRKWGQLGLGGNMAGHEIQTYGYSAPGFEIYFERNLFHWTHQWNPNIQHYVEPKQVTPDADGTKVASDAMLSRIEHDKYGIGIAAMMHVKDHPGLKVLPISFKDGGPYAPITPETVKNRSYPFSRDAFVYINRAPGQPVDAKTKEFLRFVLSREGQAIIQAGEYEGKHSDGTYNPLTPTYLKEQLKKLD
jgi:phosphate transport system substrate-binding protein